MAGVRFRVYLISVEASLRQIRATDLFGLSLFGMWRACDVLLRVNGLGFGKWGLSSNLGCLGFGLTLWETRFIIQVLGIQN